MPFPWFFSSINFDLIFEKDRTIGNQLFHGKSFIFESVLPKTYADVMAKDKLFTSAV
ncbi:MAG: hypothetical protein ACI9S8_002525 [Chlamydiales bacterium]|jgi:hypothetical protein